MATIAEKYASAIYDSRKKTGLDERAFFLAIEIALKKRHHENLVPQILRAYEKLASKKSSSDALVKIASHEDEKTAVAKARELGVENPEVKIDPLLVRGFSIEGRDFRFDASARRALINLYARLTA
jgi:F0F1-type ATP synthase delta subunit